MKRSCFVFLLAIGASQASFAQPKTFNDLMQTERADGFKHFSPVLGEWMFSLVPQEINRSGQNLKRQRAQLEALQAAYDESIQELTDKKSRLRYLAEEKAEARERYRGAMETLELSMRVLGVERKSIPAFLKNLEAQEGKSSVRFRIVQPWLKMIASEKEFPALEDAEVQVVEAWRAFREVFESGEKETTDVEDEDGFVIIDAANEKPVDVAFIERVLAGLKNLDARLINLVKQICKEGQASDPKFCGDGTIASLDKLLDAEITRLTTKSSDGSIRSKLLRHLTELRVVRSQEEILQEFTALDAQISSLRRNVEANRQDVDSKRRVLQRERESLRPGLKEVNRDQHRLYSFILGNLIEKLREARNSNDVATLEIDGNEKKVTLRDLRGAFITTMLALEKFEYAVVDEMEDEYPYPDSSLSLVDWLKDYFNPSKEPRYKQLIKLYEEEPEGSGILSIFSSAFKSSENRDDNVIESKKEIMWNYYLALHGIETTTELYGKVKTSLVDKMNNYSLADARQFVNKFNPRELVEYFRSFAEFSERYPVLAIDFVRNLRHTYSITIDNSYELLDTIQRVYAIKESENVAREWLLGDLDHVYVQELSQPPPTLEQLAIIDFAERAPYIAAAIKNGMGKGTGRWVQELLGSGFGGRIVAALVGVAQVRAEKYAASKISHQHEVTASVLRRAFARAYEGAGPKEIAKSAALYLGTREFIRGMGTAKVLAARRMLADEVVGCAKDNAREGIIAALASTPFAILAGAATTILGVAVLPVAIVVGGVAVCSAVTMVAVDRLSGRRAKRLTESNRKFLQGFELPTTDPKQRAQIANAKQRFSNEQAAAILEAAKGVKGAEQREIKMVELYKEAIQSNLKDAEEDDFKEKFSAVRSPDWESDPLARTWEQIAKAGGNKERTDIATQALMAFGGEAKEADAVSKIRDFGNESEKQLAAKIVAFKEFLRGNPNEQEIQLRMTEIRDLIRLLPFREVKAELIRLNRAN